MHTTADSLELKRWPAWAYSLILHVLICVLLVVFVRPSPVGGSDEPERPAAIVLAQVNSDGHEYLTESSESASLADSALADTEDATAKDALPSESELSLNDSELTLPDIEGFSLPSGGDVTFSQESGRQRNTSLAAEDDSAFIAAEAAARAAARPQGAPASISLFDGPAAQGHDFVFCD